MGISDAISRMIEFRPASALVYQDMADFFSNSKNLANIPNRFTVRSLNYTHGSDSAAPESIKKYIQAVQLTEMVSKLADHQSNAEMSQHFIKSHDSKLEVQITYLPTDLVHLDGLDKFITDFANTTHHQDQKRNIVRSSLLEVFKGKRRITVSEIIQKFETLKDSIQSSYALYTADFSYEKIRYEVETKNLDDTLRLNKTVSEIQNQLLALPAALLLAGAGIQSGSTLKNIAIWVGICIFAAMMWILVGNQNHSVLAIKGEISLRKGKLEEQPEDVSKKFIYAFDALENRARVQKRVLKGIRFAVIFVWLVVTTMILDTFYPNLFSSTFSLLLLAFEKIYAYLFT